MRAEARNLLCRWFFALALPILLVLLGARLTLTPTFLQLEYQRPGLPADPYGLTSEARIALGGYALDYLFNNANISFLADLRLPGALCKPATDQQDCAMFSAPELRHMRDVKAVLKGATLLGFALAGIAICLMIACRSSRRSAIAGGLQRGSLLTLAGIALLSTLAAAAWDSAFAGFHELFFAAGTWRFPFSATLIRLYPERLFVDAALVIALLAGLGALLILAITRRFIK